MANKKLYIDYETSNLIDSISARVFTAPPVAYQEQGIWTLNLKTWTSGTLAAVDVSDASTWAAAIDDDFNSASAPMVRVLNADIDSSGAANGIISVELDANTATFLSALSTNEKIAAYFELRGLSVGGKILHYIEFPITARNTIDPSGGTPPDPVGNYYTKTESDSKYLQSAGAADLEVTDAAKGVILKDRGDGKRYRINITNGIIGIEEV